MTIESTIIDSILLALVAIFSLVAYRQKAVELKQKLLPVLLVISVNMLIAVYGLLGINDTDYSE